MNIENLAKEMILSKNISSDSLNKIQKIFDKYKYGHFFIKAPDGSYGVAYYTGCLYGTMLPGEFMIIPNDYFGFRKGNYVDYAIDPVDAIVEICSYENTGWNRRNLYTYDYKAHDTPNGQKYGVDIYVTNDNGLNVGLNTSNIVTYVYFNDEYYPASEIPQNPDKLYVGSYIFEKQSINSIFEIMDSPDNAVVNSESSIYYMINNIDDQRTVVFDLDENVEYVSAITYAGECNYDPVQHYVYWDLQPSLESKPLFLTVKPKVKGDYTIRSYVQGMEEENVVTTHASNPGVILTADNVTTYKTYYKSLNVYLTDEDGVALIGEKVSIMINGTTYWREVTPRGHDAPIGEKATLGIDATARVRGTAPDGYAALSIMLQPGEYDAVISYDGQFGKSQTTSKIIVNKTIISNDLEVFYGQTYAFNVSFLDENGSALAVSSIDFCVDGILINQLTNDDGTYSLRISEDTLKIPKLKPGNHTIISYNGRTNEFVSNTVIIKEPVCDLAISKTANASSIFIGDGVKWTINVSNDGPCDAHDVVVTDALPSGVEFISYDASNGAYDAKSGIWTIGNLTIGESAILDLYCIALEEGIITNDVYVTCNETDSNSSNNRANSTVEIIKNKTPINPKPMPPVKPENNVTEDSVGISATGSAKMLATGNPIAYLIIVIMGLFGSFWIQKRQK